MIELSSKNFRNILISFFGGASIYFFGYYPYGYYPSALASISSIVVIYILSEIVLNKNIKYIYLGVFLSLNWVYFQSPFLLPEKTYYFTRVIDENDIPDIALYCCLSIFLIFIGYNFFFNRLSSHTSKKLIFKESTLVRLILIFLALGLFDSLGSRLFPALMGSLSNVVQVFFYSYTVAFGLFTLLLLRSSKKFRFSFFNILVISLFLLEFLLRISSTMFVRTAFLFAGIFIAYFYEKRTLPIFYIIISLLILVPFYQTRKYFRAVDVYKQDTYSRRNDRSNFERGQDFVSKIYTDEGAKQFSNFEKGLEAREKFQSNRFENLSFIAHVVYLHRLGMKDFLYGETFYWLPLTPIPRLIWKDKPINLMSSTFATEYGLRGKDSGDTSINFPMLVEAFVNFGYSGMLVMAFLFGFVLKWFVMKFGVGLGDINLIIMMNAIKHFAHAEGNITLVFGALLQVLIFWFVLIKFFGITKTQTNI